MSKATLSITQKKEWAEMLYLQNQFNQKEIATKVGVSEPTLSKWVKEGVWEKKRKSLTMRKPELLAFYYDLLDKQKEKIIEKDYEVDSKQADQIVKITTAINTLETETSVSALMDAGMKFHKHLQLVNPQLALTVLNEYDGFIKNELKKF